MKYRLLISSALTFAASPAYAIVPFSGWDVNAYNSVHAEYYDTDGAAAASPFAFDGGQHYDEWSFSLAKQYSPFRRARIQAFGVANASDYRLPDEGFIPERLSAFYEDGEASTPYRFELGDYYSGVSYRTQQRMMKGASVELQPQWSGQTHHSILLFEGSNVPYYTNVDLDNDMTSGASWLIENGSLGRLAFNGLYNYQEEPTATLTGTNNSQVVGSTAWEKDFMAGTQSLNLTGEAAYFNGDWGTTKDADDSGLFGEFSGYSLDPAAPVDYRLRYERYGTDYRPNGALITPDRQSYEAHAGWRFETGQQLRGRLQRFEDSFDSTNQQDTDVAGIQLLGRLFGEWAPDVNGSTDLFTQRIEDDLRITDLDTDTWNFTITKPLCDLWTGEFTGFFQDQEDNTITNLDSLTRQIGFGVYHPIMIGDFTGTIHPGIVLRGIEYNGAADSTEWEPALAIDLGNGSHYINASYGYLRQNRTALTVGDTAVQNASLDYSYTFGDNEIGLNAAYFSREVNAGLDTDAYRVGAYWTVHLDRPAQTTAAASGGTPFDGDALAGTTKLATKAPAAALLTQVKPGMTLAEAEAELAVYGVGAKAELPAGSVYEVNLLRSIPARQRLVLEHKDGRVERVALIVDNDANGTPQTLTQSYESVKEALVKSLGKPSNVVEEGQLEGAALSKLVLGNVVRVAEWETDAGKIRLGLPRQVDGSPRIEIIHASGFGSPRSQNWGLGNVR